MNHSDVLIIGGGMGGLFTGALLARNGRRVTVLEKNVTAGGGLQTFRRGSDIFDTGMHILGGFSNGGSVRRICEYLGILDNLEIRPVDADCMDSVMYSSDGMTYRIAPTRDGFIKSLSTYFPNEHDGLIRYVDKLYALTEEVDMFHLRTPSHVIPVHSDDFMSPADMLIRRYVSDSRLRDLLAYMNPLYGGVAGHTPAYIHALINVLYIEGPSRFAGGSSQLADSLVNVIAGSGGRVFTGHEVVAVDATSDGVRSVTTSDGATFTADTYVSAVFPAILNRILRGYKFPKPYRCRLEEIPLSTSAFSVFVRLKPKRIPYINHTCYWQRDYGMVWHHFECPPESWPSGFMYMTPPEPEQGEYASKLLVNCLMDYSEVERWDATRTGHRGADYEEWKREKVGKVFDCMEQIIPGFIEAVDRWWAASPLTIRDYYGISRGSMYGYRKDCQNIMLSQIPIYTKLRNLFLTGQNVNLHGICGVPLTAIQTTEAILGENIILRTLNSQVKR